ncbi:MAG: 2-alkenal reductase [Deltaproteobacteria bacterium]|nr:2-alkenal reductase [Deltaproteobacteria bacterium]
MAPDEPTGTRPAGPVVLRIKLRYDDVDTMVHRFAPNVGKSGLFLPTKSLQPLDAELKFELRLANDTPVLVGLGRVKAVKPPDPSHPKAAFGMAIELMRVTRESRDLILRMLERRRQLGLAETSIPMADDIDAARQGGLVDTSVRDLVSGPASAMLPPPGIDGKPDGLLTSPRRASGPIAVAAAVARADRNAVTVTPLAPEPARRKRPLPAELIESASGPIGQLTVPGLDDEVDVAAVLVRARVLAGGDVEAELEALRESSAVPIEIGIEAASAELAKQLGGTAVRRDRSARWAPPPAVAQAMRIEPEPEPEPEVAAALAVPLEPAVVDEPPRGRFDNVVDAEAETVFPFRALQTEPPPEPAGEELEVQPDQIADEIHQLSEEDFEEVEHTQVGDRPFELDAFDHLAAVARPEVDDEDLARQLDAHLAELEIAHEDDDFGIGEASGLYDRTRHEPAPVLPPTPLFELAPSFETAADPHEAVEPERDFVHQFDGSASDPESALEPPSDVDHEAATAGAYGGEGIDASGGYDSTVLYGEADPVVDLDLSDQIEEIDDFEILSDVHDDADLMASRGEADSSLQPELPPERLSQSDFALRLDLDDEALGDDSDAPAQSYYGNHDELGAEPGELDPRVASAGHALAAFDDQDSDGGFEDLSERAPIPDARMIYDDSLSYTVPGELAAYNPLDFDGPGGSSSLSKFDESDGMYAEAALARPADEVDLESALEALDVDLDDLSIPHSPTELVREGSSPPRPASGRAIRPASRQSGSSRIVEPAPTARAHRAPSIRGGDTPTRPASDGVLIDFDDDDDDL